MTTFHMHESAAVHILPRESTFCDDVAGIFSSIVPIIVKGFWPVLHW